MQKKHAISAAGIGIIAVILLLCVLASLIVLSGRVLDYNNTSFVNIMSLTETKVEPSNAPYATAPSENTSGGQTSSNGQSIKSDPQFVMNAEAEIFKFSYDETGKVTVIGVEGNPDKLIAPGTSNLYQFTLENPGNVALDYDLEMYAYVTGTDLWLPVKLRVWDYKNEYLAGSETEMIDALDLDVNLSGELGAGRYAPYYLEWEWPFEWDDDEYDTFLGNLAVDEDLTLHIVIRTYAEYDEQPDDPNAGQLKPPGTGDHSDAVLLIVVCVLSFLGLCAMTVAFFTKRRKEKQTE